jgi:PPOX class probable F420-dependent enzyme
MTADERDEYLRRERTCRVATVNGDGSPHLSALWFVWDGEALWLNSIVKSQRWVNIERDPRVSVLVDGGEDFGELRGVELNGRVETVAEVPRTGNPNDDVAEPERLFGEKYAGGQMGYDGRHAWLKLLPDKIVSWDFRKIPSR